MSIEDWKKLDTEQEQALRDSLALSEVVRDLLAATKAQLKRVYIICLVSLLANVIIACGFFYLVSGVETTTTETITTTTEQEASGENAEINNAAGDFYKDNAVHNEGVTNDGESATENH